MSEYSISAEPAIAAVTANTAVDAYDADASQRVKKATAAQIAAYILANPVTTGLIRESAATGITAGTTRTQAGATALTSEINRVDTSTSISGGGTLGDGVSLPLAQAGLDIIVINNTANAIQVYGAGTDTINGVATATGVSQMPNSCVLYVVAAAAPAGAYFSEGLASGFSGSLQPFSIASGITAFAGGGQAGAQASATAQLNAMINNVTTVATAADSVALPAAKPGLEIIIRNGGANSMQVFGAGTDTINSIPTATGVPQDPNTVVTYNCWVAGNWISTPDASKPGQLANAALSSAVFSAGQLTGAGFVTYVNTANAPGTLTTRTATQMFNDAHNAQVGQTYMLMIVHSGSGTMTIAAGTGVTLAALNSGATTLAATSWRLFAMKFTSATTMTMTSVATGTWS